MDKLTTFSNNLKQLLLQKKKDGKISNLSKNEILSLSPLINETSGEMRYFIDSTILDKLSDDIKNEIEAIWIADK